MKHITKTSFLFIIAAVFGATLLITDDAFAVISPNPASLSIENLINSVSEKREETRASCLAGCDRDYPWSSGENNLNKENRKACKKRLS